VSVFEAIGWVIIGLFIIFNAIDFFRSKQ